MKIKSVDAKPILDSRGEKTIFVKIQTDFGEFSASSPTGKSTGKFEAKTYKKSLEEDIKALKKLKDYFCEDSIDKFSDLRRIEDIVDGHIGANTLFALGSCVLKAVAKEQKKEVWEIINDNSHEFSSGLKKPNFPRLAGNCVGGGKHSEGIGRKTASPKEWNFGAKRPDFQEFLLIPNEGSVKANFIKNKEIKIKIGKLLKKEDENFKGTKNDENAWMTSLNEKQVLDILKRFNVDLGLDIAASGFYRRKKYCYENPMLKRDIDEQLGYLENLIKNYPLMYIEDPMDEKDFEGFSALQKKFPKRMIVGDDLTVTHLKRLKKAVKEKSITAIIVKPNQCGSLLEVKRVCEFARENNIKIIFSHRSGETEESILADLAFGFQADFFKCGTEGDVRINKIKRLIEIEESFN
jgi:enolase